MSATITLFRYVRPEEIAQPIDLADGSALYYSERNGRFCASLFLGRSKRNACPYWFRSAEQRAAWCGDRIEARKSWGARRAAAAAERKAYRTDLTAGAILYRTWGYDQTNADFYEVVGVATSGKTITVRKIKATIVQTGFMSGDATPVPGAYCSEPIIARVSTCGGATIKGDHVSRLDPIRSVHVSWYA